MTTNVDIANRALAESGSRSRLTVIDSTTTEGIYIGLLYNSLRDFLLREGDYDFAALYTTPTSVTAPLFPWTYAYQYPVGALRIRQLIPAVYTPLNPQPFEWNVFSIAGLNRIFTNMAVSLILYTFAPDENNWDAMFTESFVRLLSSSLLFALSNRIEASKERLNEAITFAGIANLRDA